ncbi:N-acetyl-1-D-myo-inositol-2-amino-2-deoxy-alpha-D-glucopyranoside deacetylase [Corynebacterium sp. AOP40-9SA-29]|uniref:N-acetyl-1-D-myo-inositol-2-amino-2-deoxy-alpha- D-glucopyranoside deacetylase n=1 Tax=Corynebacterium sp. AOP40-9SA-29 TaxID=3457677 RepID=UPI00403399A7
MTEQTTKQATEPGDLAGLRILAVHAHPDDESIWGGLALANWVRRGAEVTVVTCTLGEEGEVIGDKYADLVADKYDILGGYRIAELQRALGELGLGRPRFLGGPGRWRDSGMVGTPAAEHPRAFVNSEQTAVDQLADIFDELRPHVVITYGPDGGYGHPDHIRAHEITHAAAAQAAQAEQEAGDGRWVPARIYWTAQERERVEAGLRELDTQGEPPQGWRRPAPGELATVPARVVDARVEGSEADLTAKRRAMVAHATQIWVADGSVTDVNDRARTGTADSAGTIAYCLSNLIAQPLLDTESYTLGGEFPVRGGVSQETVNRLDCLFVEGR